MPAIAVKISMERWWWWSDAECPQMSIDILGKSWDQCRSMVQYSFTSTETRRLVRTDSPGRPLRLSHSSWTMSMERKLVCVLNFFQFNSCITRSTSRLCERAVEGGIKLQALVHDILPPTTAIVDHAIGLEELSANEQFFWCCWNDRKSVTVNSDYTRRFFDNRPRCLCWHKWNQNRLNRDVILCFYPGRTRFMFTCVLGRYVTATVLIVSKPFGGRWQRRWTAARR